MDNDEYISNIIRNQFETSLNEFEELAWAYVVLSKKERSCIYGVTNYPEEWVRYYQEEGLQYIDPVVITALHRLTPFSWDEKLLASPEFRFSRFINPARESGIVNGYTFVLHDYNHNLVTLTFAASSGRRAEIMPHLNQKKGNLSMLLASAHETWLALTSLTKKNSAGLESLPRFTNRENEILYWASMGKTYQETGMILGIKVHTVKFHMSNIVKKLGVANARHAVRIGVELQLIQPVN